MNYLLLLGKTNHPIKESLGKLFEIKEFSNKLVKNADAILIDLAHVTELDDKEKNEIKKNCKPIILINKSTDKELMSTFLGIGFSAELSIVHLYENNTYINPIISESEIQQSVSALETINIENNNGTSQETLGKVESSSKKNVNSKQVILNLEEMALLIEENIQEENWTFTSSTINRLSTPPIDLPVGQYKVYHVPLNSVINLYDSSQKAENEMLVEIILVASYNPKRKYVQMNTIGAGFNPTSGTKMQWDGTYNRGYFQNKIDLHFEPLNNSKITTYQTSPKNVNGETTYTASSSFTVGVDISENPAFKPSYTIGSSESTTIKDFEITNNSSGKKADWTFQLSQTKNSMWDMFKSPFMKKGQVKSVPNLAKKNLQPVCTSVWMVDETSGVFNDSVSYNLRWNVEYYRCWVTGNWASFTKHVQPLDYNKTINFLVDYSKVNA
ncbi:MULTISPECIES: hypothetical protein [Tenacibaculum]|uniref:hypothetical protein n=1 Tax=Tenacibaculum TaxID=104267 RepID=UPI00089CDE7F|nr:hypothetical protein [Tenacibaculum sp. MAR_2010_89]SEE30216.1 hypothetical protein SAMN04487765_2064 [Tenacibaculum sp. MAR_2010_89]